MRLELKLEPVGLMLPSPSVGGRLEAMLVSVMGSSDLKLDEVARSDRFAEDTDGKGESKEESSSAYYDCRRPTSMTVPARG